MSILNVSTNGAMSNTLVLFMTCLFCFFPIKFPQRDHWSSLSLSLWSLLQYPLSSWQIDLCDVKLFLTASNDSFIITDWLVVLHSIYIISHASRIEKKNIYKCYDINGNTSPWRSPKELILVTFNFGGLNLSIANNLCSRIKKCKNVVG